MSKSKRVPASAAGDTGDSAQIPQDVRMRLFRLMCETRGVEKRAHDLFLQNLVKGTSHLALGHEAVAAGMALAMRPDDYAFLTYRGHHHTIARGASMAAVLGELMGRECGLMAGKGGSMHLASVEHRVMASYAIIGSQLTIANGAAWSAQYRGTQEVAVAFFGDGGANIGAFHEAVNLAAVWKLPVVFVCENNLYMEYTATRHHTAVTYPAADRAAGYGLERIVIDGNDVETVYLTGLATLARARSGQGPSIVECLTYRQGGHSRADPAKYRPPGELEAWLKRDPLKLYRQRLLDRGTAESQIATVEAETARAVDQATEVAKASPPAPVDIAFKDVWADGGIAWRN